MWLALEKRQGNSWCARWALPALAAAAVVLLTCGAAHAAAPKQKTFADPEAAVTALVESLKMNNTKALAALAGPGSRDIVASGDPAADAARRKKFVELYEQKHKLEQPGADRAVLYVGPDDWPFPIPIVKQGAAWHFDTAAGRREILARRIGQNELSVIQVCLAYVDAQQEYGRMGWDGAELRQYAQQFVSDRGRRNGLYWPSREGEMPSPLGPLVTTARKAGYRRAGGGRPTPYHGYYYRILKAQGPHAPGGAYDYVVGGKMIGGFALVAYPARYGVSGITSFLVNQDGVVYQKDLGEGTEKLARAMKAFDPDDTWTRVKEPAAQAK